MASGIVFCRWFHVEIKTTFQVSEVVNRKYACSQPLALCVCLLLMSVTMFTLRASELVPFETKGHEGRGYMCKLSVAEQFLDCFLHSCAHRSQGPSSLVLLLPLQSRSYWRHRTGRKLTQKDKSKFFLFLHCYPGYNAPCKCGDPSLFLPVHQLLMDDAHRCMEENKAEVKKAAKCLLQEKTIGQEVMGMVTRKTEQMTYWMRSLKR